MPKKITRKGLVKKADATVSIYVRKRDGKCVTCGSYDNPQCGHLFSRYWYGTRWDLLNCNTQCSKCNFLHEVDSLPYQNWFKQRYGSEVFEDLHRRARAIAKYTDQDLLKIISEVQEAIKDLD